jgi:hypothetical protein
VEPSEILVGEPIRYVITVTRPARARAELPAVRGNTGRLDVEGYRLTTDTLSDGRVRETHALALTAWSPGDDTLPSQRVEIRAEGDTAAIVLYTPPTAVTVRATAPKNPNDAKDGNDIADIRDAERLPGSLPWGLLLLAVVALVIWNLLRLRARRPNIVPKTAAPIPTPAEIALARLRELEEAALPSREFAFALSEILRGYLAARFGVDALEATTEELLERVRPVLHAGRVGWLREFCESLDRVKFADAALSPVDAASRVEEARAFIRETTVVHETAAAREETPNEAGPA